MPPSNSRTSCSRNHNILTRRPQHPHIPPIASDGEQIPGDDSLTSEEAIKISKSPYRAAVVLALAATFILVWLALGVGILGRDGDPANLMYGGVLAIGIIGAITARFKPHGMSLALLAMALGQVLVTVIALIAGVHRSGVSPVAEIVSLNAFFIAMFLGSAWLFRTAAGE